MASRPARAAKSKKLDRKGRNQAEVGSFTRLGHDLLGSTAYRSLTPNARALLVELASLYNGRNNGSLWLSVRDAADRMGVADTKAAQRAFQDLMDAGFIDMTKDAFFSVKTSMTSRARCWRLTWLFDHSNKKPATNRWKQWEPEAGTAKRRASRGLLALKAYRKAQSENKMPVVDFSTMQAEPAIFPNATVVDSSTANKGNDAIQPFAIVGDSSTHIDSTMGVLETRGNVWQ